jgi:hypothetical protein
MAVQVSAKPIGRKARDRFERAGTIFSSFPQRSSASASLFNQIIASSYPPTMSSVATAHAATRHPRDRAVRRRNYAIDPLPDFGRSHKRCTTADARSEIADAEIARRRLHDEPPRHFREPASQQADVETQTPRDIVPDLLLRAQQIEKQRAVARFADDSRDELIARTVPAAGAAVCEYHDTVCSASRLTRRFREERLDDFFQVGALAFRAVHFLGLVFLDGQHFTKFVMALAADVFVKGHRLVRSLSLLD